MIDVIKNNPFRVLGLKATASDKEITKRVAELEVFIKMGERKKYDLDFPFLGNFKRTSETLQDAVNKLNKPVDRFFYSLFWFDNIDEFEFEKMKEENINEAITIIKNSSDNRKIEKLDQFSGYKNLSILYLYLIYNDDDDNEEKYFEKYFYAFSKCLTSNYLNIYMTVILKNKNIIDCKSVIKKYLDVIDEILSDYLCIDIECDREFIERFLSSLYSYPDEIKKYERDKYTNIALNYIRNEIKKCNKIRENSPEEAYESGANLYFNTDEYLTFLKNILSISDVSYKIISDKLAEEILKCSIDYYNRYYDSDDGIDPGEESLEISEYADIVAVGKRLKERIAKDLETTQNWVDGKEEREKQKKVDSYINFIREEIDNLSNFFYDISDYPNILEKFILKCKIHLSKLKTLLGVLDTLYWKISNSVVDNALNLIIEYTNKTKDTTKIVILSDDLANIDMNGETKERFLKNLDIIENNHRLHLKNLEIKENEKISNNRDYTNFLKKYGKSKTKKKMAWGCLVPLVLILLIGILGTIFDKEENNKEKIIESGNAKYLEPINDYKEKTKIFDTSKKIEISKFKGNQLENGSSPYNDYFGYFIYNKNFLNEITFKNGYSTDAIVCLVDYYTDKTIRNEYIRKNTNFKMTNITSGTYYIKVFSGNDWNPDKLLANGKIKGGFENDINYSVSDEYDDLIKLEQTEDSSGIEYSIYTITLYQVASGNMESETISEKDFFK